MDKVSITIVVDDTSKSQKIKGIHGLALYVEAYSRYILFDTGPSDEVLRDNTEALELDLSMLDAVVLSHIHSPHIGGLPYIGWVAPTTTTYIPFSSGPHLEQRVKKNSLEPVEVDELIEIYSGIVITQPIYGPPWEHFLAIRSPRGLLVFSGCMHPGVEKVFETIKHLLGDEIYGIIGGLHLYEAPDRYIERAIDYLIRNVEVIVPLHCTGKRAVDYIRSKAPSKLVIAGAGDTIEL